MLGISTMAATGTPCMRIRAYERLTEGDIARRAAPRSVLPCRPDVTRQALQACMLLTLSDATFFAAWAVRPVLLSTTAATCKRGVPIDACNPKLALTCPTLQCLQVIRQDGLVGVCCIALWRCGVVTTCKPHSTSFDVAILEESVRSAHQEAGRWATRVPADHLP
jgi:hypothetical protein